MEKEVSFTDLRLSPGAKLDLRSDQYSVLKGLSQYVGYQGKNIIVTTPLVNGKPVPCKPNTQITLRFFVNHMNCVCAFRSQVVYAATAPFHHLFIAAPKEIEVGEVRGSTRVNVKLPCKVTSTAEFRKANQLAVIENVSVEGAKILSKNFIGDEGEEVKVTTKVTVLNIEEVIHIKAIIRKSGKAGNSFAYGLEFIDMDKLTRLLVYSYVVSQIK